MPRGSRVLILTGLFSALVSSLSAVAGSAGQQQPPAAAERNIFTGKVDRLDPALNTVRLRFAAGARTVWHTHKNGQVLFVQEGLGRWQVKGGPVQELVPGQPVWSPPGVPHWHGAAPDRAMVQVAVYSGETAFHDAVTDAEYLDLRKRR